jgi:hypothetical protein
MKAYYVARSEDGFFVERVPSEQGATDQDGHPIPDRVSGPFPDERTAWRDAERIAKAQGGIYKAVPTELAQLLPAHARHVHICWIVR